MGPVRACMTSIAGLLGSSKSLCSVQPRFGKTLPGLVAVMLLVAPSAQAADPMNSAPVRLLAGAFRLPELLLLWCCRRIRCRGHRICGVSFLGFGLISLRFCFLLWSGRFGGRSLISLSVSVRRWQHAYRRTYGSSLAASQNCPT
jgi:hypothetical protein